MPALHLRPAPAGPQKGPFEDGTSAGIYVTSLGSRAVGDMLVAHGLTHSTAIIIHELTPDRQALLKQRAIDAIVNQNPELEALTAAERPAHSFGWLEARPTELTTSFTLFFLGNSCRMLCAREGRLGHMEARHDPNLRLEFQLSKSST